MVIGKVFFLKGLEILIRKARLLAGLSFVSVFNYSGLVELIRNGELLCLLGVMGYGA